MTTGERIKARRKVLGFSAEYVAERLGVSPATIYRYEKGDIEKVPGDTIIKLAEILCTTPEYLMGWDNPQSSDVEFAGLMGRAFSQGGELKEIIADIFKLSSEQLPMLSKIIKAMLEE